MLSEGRRRKISSGFKLMKWSPFCNRRLLPICEHQMDCIACNCASVDVWYNLDFTYILIQEAMSDGLRRFCKYFMLSY